MISCAISWTDRRQFDFSKRYLLIEIVMIGGVLVDFMFVTDCNVNVVMKKHNGIVGFKFVTKEASTVL
jgi:hypothetical protein